MKLKSFLLMSSLLMMLTFTVVIIKVGANPDDIHDIATLSVEPSKTEVVSGEMVEITVVVKNLGNVSESFNVTTYYDDSEIDTLSVTELVPGENVTLTFEWDTTGLENCTKHKISANATDVPEDVNTENNFFEDGTVTIVWEESPIKHLGDLNGDCIVDMKDIVRAARAFGSCAGPPPHSRWDEDADMNNDDKVDMRDLVKIARNFGTTHS